MMEIFGNNLTIFRHFDIQFFYRFLALAYKKCCQHCEYLTKRKLALGLTFIHIFFPQAVNIYEAGI